jgi:hypothetical protein
MVAKKCNLGEYTGKRRTNDSKKPSGFLGGQTSLYICKENLECIIVFHQLSPKEKNIFFSHIKGEDFEDYAYKNAMKLESVKRIFRNALSKIANKEEIKKFHCIEVITLIFLKNRAVYMDLLNITDLMVK